MTDINELRRKRSAELSSKANVSAEVPGLMGRVSDGALRISSRPGYIYVRIGSDETLAQAYWLGPVRYDQPVVCGFRGQSLVFRVLELRQDTYTMAGYQPIPEVDAHRATHEWPIVGDADYDGSDIIYPHWRQIRNLRVSLVSAFTVQVEQAPCLRSSGYMWVTTQQVDLTASVPGSGARYVLIYLDKDGTIGTTNGSVVSKASIDFGDVPVPTSEQFALASVLLWQSQTALRDDAEQQDIVDLRFPQAWSASPSGGGTWENLIIVAKLGGQYDTVAGGLAVGVSGDVVAVMPGDYDENVSVDTDSVDLMAAYGMSFRTLLSGADDDGPVLDLTSQSSIVDMSISRTLGATGSGAYILVDATEAAKYPRLAGCFVNIDGNGQGRVVTALKISGAAANEALVTACIIKEDDGAAGSAALVLDGGLVTVRDCVITGDVLCSGATTVKFIGCEITGDVTGMAGADLILQDTYISGTIATWDSVDYRTGPINAEDVLVESLSGATYDDVQDFVNYHSSGFISGGAITDSGSGEIDVATGTGVIRAVATEVSPAFFFDWPLTENIALTDNETNWVFVTYGGGTPAVDVDTDITNIDLLTEIVIGRVYRDGTDLHIIDVGQKVSNHSTEACYKDFEVHGIQRASGVIVSEPANLKLASSAGVLYCAHNRMVTVAQNTNVADTFVYWYDDGAGGWTQVAAQTDIDPDHYDDGDGVLGNVSNNNFGVHWVYVDYDGHLHVQYGTGNYNKLSDAEAATVPTPPDLLRDFSILAAMIICEKGATSFDELLSAFQQQFSATPVTDHNDLAGLQGGMAAEYYHTTSAEHTALLAAIADQGANEVFSGPAAGADAAPAFRALVAADIETISSITWTAAHTFLENIIITDEKYIGFGAAAGRIAFDDQAPDEINFLDCQVGIGVPSPTTILYIRDTNDNDYVFAKDASAVFSGTAGMNATAAILLMDADLAADGAGIWYKSASRDWFAGMTGSTDDKWVISRETAAALLVVNSAGILGIGETSPAISDGVGLHIGGKIIRMDESKTPATAGADGNVGEICWDADYVYVCVATDTWKRTAIATW